MPRRWTCQQSVITVITQAGHTMPYRWCDQIALRLLFYLVEDSAGQHEPLLLCSLFPVQCARRIHPRRIHTKKVAHRRSNLARPRDCFNRPAMSASFCGGAVNVESSDDNTMVLRFVNFTGVLTLRNEGDLRS